MVPVEVIASAPEVELSLMGEKRERHQWNWAHHAGALQGARRLVFPHCRSRGRSMSGCTWRGWARGGGRFLALA